MIADIIHMIVETKCVNDKKGTKTCNMGVAKVKVL